MKRDEYRVLLARQMLEAELQENVMRLARTLGCLAYHPYDSRKSTEGYPDYTFVGPGGVLFRELKREGKSPTGPQSLWLARLVESGSDAGVWRPADWFGGVCERELRAIAARR